jgi:predicted P-loop ATPase
LFAEAVARFRAGESWWEVPKQAAAIHTDERRPEDPWEEIIGSYLDDHRTYSARELLGTPLQIDIEHQSNAAAKRVGVILRRLGWTSYVARAGDSTVKRWRKLPDVTC